MPSTTPAAPTWRVTGGYPTTQTPWYPRSSDQMMMDNAVNVDEPNQQGLESSCVLVSFSNLLMGVSIISLMLLSR